MESGEVAEAIEGPAPDIVPDEAPAFAGEEPAATAPQGSGTSLKGPEGGPDASFAPKPEGADNAFMPHPCGPPTHCCWDPCPPRQQSWEALQIPEPGAPGLPWSPESRAPQEPIPRGQCLIHNWVEERATNELDLILHPEENESFRYRHGHLGLLTLELCSPQISRTTQMDSYQSPGNPRRALRGRREAMLEILLQHHIRKEVDQEFSPKEYFNYESVTHHDYRKELERPGPPPPTKPHSLQEQPETYWLQQAPHLRGINTIRMDDTPFRRNSSFSTPVHLSLEQPLSYGPENYPGL